MSNCERCGGNGKETGDGPFYRVRPRTLPVWIRDCPDCNGTGEVDKNDD